jgi:hypothetical protein
MWFISYRISHLFWYSIWPLFSHSIRCVFSHSILQFIQQTCRPSFGILTDVLSDVNLILWHSIWHVILRSTWSHWSSLLLLYSICFCFLYLTFLICTWNTNEVLMEYKWRYIMIYPIVNSHDSWYYFKKSSNRKNIRYYTTNIRLTLALPSGYLT